MRMQMLALCLIAGLSGCSSPVPQIEGRYHVAQSPRSFTSVLNGNWSLNLRYPLTVTPGQPDTRISGTLDLFHGAAYPIAAASGAYRIGSQVGRFEGSYAYFDSLTLKMSPMNLPGLGRASVEGSFTLDDARRSATGQAVFTYETADGTRSIRGSAQLSRS